MLNVTIIVGFCNQAESQIHHEILHGNNVLYDRPMNIVNVVGAIPKSPKKVRFIHNANRPIGESPNDYTSDNSCHIWTYVMLVN